MRALKLAMSLETMPRLTEAQRARLVGLIEGGDTQETAATIVGCSRQTVVRWWNSFMEDSRLTDQPRRLKNRATTEMEDLQIVSLAWGPYPPLRRWVVPPTEKMSVFYPVKIKKW
jgi:transposase-like protein